ncbi:MAG: hypothetical protein ACFCUX_07470, partial [Candidatus Methylacidiphilales bacterium]
MKPVSGKNGFAIVSVLLVVAVLTIMVVAFMQSMRIDRLTALAYLNKTKAEMAAEAGIQNAISALMDATQGDRAYVVAVELPDPDTSAILVIRKAVTAADGTITLEDHALMSGTRDADTGNLRTIEQLNTARVEVGESLNLNGPEGWIRDFSANADANVNFYRAPMEDLSDGNGDVSSRYAFQILDEQARLNPRLHRGEVRQWGASTAEIPLSLGVIPETAEPLLTAAELATLGSILPLIPTPGSMGQAFSTTQRFAERKHLFGLYTQPNEDVIPHGYADAGLPKYNINDLAVNPVHGATATLRAEKIATLIDRNLPQFKNRDPSLASSSEPIRIRYLNRLTASIVDYIDPDNAITHVNDGEPAGRDAFPLVTAMAEQFRWTSEIGPDVDGNYSATIQNRVYAQIWNPYTTQVSGSVQMVLKNRSMVEYGTGIVTPFSDYNPPAQNVTVRPNEFVVVEFPTESQVFYSPTGPNLSGLNRPSWKNSPAGTMENPKHVMFELYWNGQRVDMSRNDPVSPGMISAGMNRNSKTLALNALHYQSSFIPTFTGSAPYRFVGDPRANYLTNYVWGSSISGDATYASGTRWKGRQQDTSPRYQDFIVRWNLRDYVRANPVLGTTPGNLGTTPNSVTSPYSSSEAANAPFYIRNADMESIGELGHIFDPAQADDNGGGPSGGNPASVFVAGGGRTLRIGQPEFPYWNNEGTLAMRL